MSQIDLFRVFLVVMAVFGTINVLRMIGRSAIDPITLGTVTMSKARWTRSIVIWNAIGIVVLAFVLFVLWKP